MYESFFGLEEAPFRLTPDPRFLFLSRRHREALGHLSFGLRDGAGFIAITGEIGAGKTTLLRSVLRDADEGVQYAYVLNPVLTGVELLQEINHELGILEEGGHRELLHALNSYLLEQKRLQRQVVIVVDEAQALDGAILEQLRMLSNFETETAKLLQIVLVGQPDLRDLLARPELTQLNQRVAVRFHLTALDARETAEYVRHRLAVAAQSAPREIFTKSALARIHRHTHGLPRLINQLCHRALLVAYSADRSRVTRRLLERAASELADALASRPAPRRRYGIEAAVAAGVVGILATVGMAVWRGDVPAPIGNRPGDEIRVSSVELGEVSVVELDSGALERVPAPAPISEATPEMAARLGFERALRHSSAGHSAYEAIEAILRGWPAAPLSPGESAAEEFNLANIAAARGLDYLSIESDLALLHLLDLPAILELQVEPGGETRFALLKRVDRSGIEVDLGGDSMILPRDLVIAHWTGMAHVLWEDVGELGPLLSLGSVGPEVQRLHELLRATGSYRGEGGEEFDEETAAAVVRFQRRMALSADGKVGPLTMIALYRLGIPVAMPRLGNKAESIVRASGEVRVGTRPDVSRGEWP